MGGVAAMANHHHMTPSVKYGFDAPWCIPDIVNSIDYSGYAKRRTESSILTKELSKPTTTESAITKLYFDEKQSVQSSSSSLETNMQSSMPIDIGGNKHWRRRC